MERIMAEQIPNLWPELKPDEIRTPLAILRQQAAFLGERTKNVVEGEVVTEPTSGDFSHVFFLRAPALGDYRYQLFRAKHGIDLYPAEVWTHVFGQRWHADDEPALLQALREIFTNEKVVRIVNSIIAQSVQAKSA
jgi:hypothetical protein